MWKSLTKIQGMSLTIIKRKIGRNSTADTMINREKLKTVLWKLGTRQGYLLLQLMFNVVLKVLARAIKSEGDKRNIKAERSQFIFAWRCSDFIDKTP